MIKLNKLLFAPILMLSLAPALSAKGSAEDYNYIEAPNTIAMGSTIKDELLEPVFYENEDGPTIGVTVVGVIEEDGLYFRDSNNNQKLDAYEDWRLDTETRVKDAVSKLTLRQQAGLVFNTLMTNPGSTRTEKAVDENGKPIFDEVFPYMEGGPRTFGTQTFYYDEISIPSLINGELRAGVLRGNPEIEVATWYNNALAQVCEYDAVLSGEVSIPWTVNSNPIGNGYPGSLGMASAVMGDVAAGGDYSMIYNYATADRQVLNAMGIDAMYGPQIDLVTDPRWNRNEGTYGEVPEVVAGITTALVTGYQNGTDGTQDGDIALNMKHFPGDGAAENGFESHNHIGQWRLYPTEGSLEKYQLVGFQAAIDANIGGIMPGYSRPTLDKRSAPQFVKGVEITAPEIGNAYNKELLTKLLREVMGFKGYINTDSGIITSENFGAEDMTLAERYAAVISAGSDVIGNEYHIEELLEAVAMNLLPKADLDRASSNRLASIIGMGRFDNPYRNTEESKATVAALKDDIAKAAYEAQQKSVVLMKNSSSALPVADTSAKVFVKYFGVIQSGGWGAPAVDPADGIKASFEKKGFTIVDDYEEADFAFLAVDPVLNNENHMSVIDLVDGLEVEERDFPESQEKTGEMISATTVPEVDMIPEIAEAVHANGGKVISSIEISSPWILTNLEPYCDALIGVFGTSTDAQLDVLTGAYNPTGKLPVTMVASNDVIAVNEVEMDGETYEICVSPNDVPGFEKDQYMDKEVLAKSPSGSYAYKDSEGNMYSAWFGLSY